jgi:hypothetical protein
MKDREITFLIAGELFLSIILVIMIPNTLQASAQQQPPAQQPTQTQQQPPAQQPTQTQQQPQSIPPEQGQQPGQLTGSKDFLTSGTINSLLTTGNTQWIANGVFNMKVIDGDVDNFVSAMTWYSSNGTAHHTHEIQNFDNDNEVALAPTNSITLMGESDVGTNGKIIWKNVPTIITIGTGKTISISLDDDKTDSHFARQPIYGLVTSIAPCGDKPGPNMQVLQSCDSSQ